MRRRRLAGFGRRAGATLLAVVVLAHVSRARAADGEPSEVDASAEQVRALLDADRWREALAAARRLAEAAPEDARAASALGQALYRAGRLAEAKTVLARLERDDPAPPARALLDLGRIRLAEGAEEEGMALLDRALAADPTDRHVRYWAAPAATSSAEVVKRLESYLALSAGDDPDRIEAARGAIRFYRSIGDRKSWIPESRPERVELPLRRVASGRRTEGYVVEATIGERKKVSLLLDTGSGGLFLVGRIARKGGFEPLAEETAFGGGGSQRHRSRRGIIPRLALGELRFRDALVNVSDVEVEPTGKYQGILGIQPFAGYRVTIDLRDEKLILDPSSSADGGESFYSVSDQILVSGGVPSGPEGLFLFDTGATRSVVDSSFAAACEGVRPGPATRIRGFGGSLPAARSVRGLRLSVLGLETGEEPIAATDLSLRSRLGGVEVSGYFGLDVLEGKRIVIDERARRVRAFSPPGPRRSR